MRRLVNEQRIAVVGVLYDVSTGKMDFMLDEAIGLAEKEEPEAPGDAA
jgi:carbonic anhydrase